MYRKIIIPTLLLISGHSLAVETSTTKSSQIESITSGLSHLSKDSIRSGVGVSSLLNSDGTLIDRGDITSNVYDKDLIERTGSNKTDSSGAGVVKVPIESSASNVITSNLVGNEYSCALNYSFPSLPDRATSAEIATYNSNKASALFDGVYNDFKLKSSIVFSETDGIKFNVESVGSRFVEEMVYNLASFTQVNKTYKYEYTVSYEDDQNQEQYEITVELPLPENEFIASYQTDSSIKYNHAGYGSTPKYLVVDSTTNNTKWHPNSGGYTTAKYFSTFYIEYDGLITRESGGSKKNYNKFNMAKESSLLTYIDAATQSVITNPTITGVDNIAQVSTSFLTNLTGSETVNGNVYLVPSPLALIVSSNTPENLDTSSNFNVIAESNDIGDDLKLSVFLNNNGDSSFSLAQDYPTIRLPESGLYNEVANLSGGSSGYYTEFTLRSTGTNGFGDMGVSHYYSGPSGTLLINTCNININ